LPHDVLHGTDDKSHVWIWQHGFTSQGNGMASLVYMIESDPARTRLLAAALGSFGLETVSPAQPAGRANRTWTAAFVGNTPANDALDAQIDRLETNAPALPLMVAADSPALLHLRERGRDCRPIDFPLRYSQVEEVVASLDGDFTPPPSDRMIGDSEPMQRVRQMIRQVAPHDTSVLLLGESGTGKEMVARTIHASSSRRHHAFVAINCGAIPSELLESELFGHEKGAFTGAIATRKGRFELAEGGTLFLDEIGDMSLPMQVKLLRVLQERVYERVGSNQTQRSNVRIIAATHRNLEQAILPGGTFREDLYYRLNVFPIELPPLRDRIDDLPLLIFDLSARLARRGLQVPMLSDGAMRVLGRCAWPGNVRELANLVELLAVLHQNGTVLAGDLPGRYRNAETGGERATLMTTANDTSEAVMDSSIHVSPVARPTAELSDQGIDLKDHLAAIETSLIRQAMELSGGVVAHAAKLLRLQRTTLVEKLRKYGFGDV
jgi:sigma-54 specific flagellar transcriptional regulator A